LQIALTVCDAPIIVIVQSSVTPEQPAIINYSHYL